MTYERAISKHFVYVAFTHSLFGLVMIYESGIMRLSERCLGKILITEIHSKGREPT